MKGVNGEMKFEYFNGRETASNCYFIIPKALQTDPELRKLSVYAKYLYGLMLDRMKLSAKNNQIDNEGRAFIYYSTESIQKDLGLGRNTVFKLLDELDADGGVGLIERVKLGQGRTSRIYVMRIVEAEQEFTEDEYAEDDVQKFNNWDSEEKEEVSEVQNVNFKKFKNGTSRSPKSNTLEVYDRDANKNNNNKNINNNLIHIYPSKSTEVRTDAIGRDAEEEAYREIVTENIAPDRLISIFPGDEAVVQGILDLMVDTLTSTKETFMVESQERSANMVKSRFMQLDTFHIESVIAKLLNLPEPPRNPKQYLMTMLYNEPLTMDASIKAEVNRDWEKIVSDKAQNNEFEELMEG